MKLRRGGADYNVAGILPTKRAPKRFAPSRLAHPKTPAWSPSPTGGRADSWPLQSRAPSTLSISSPSRLPADYHWQGSGLPKELCEHPIRLAPALRREEKRSNLAFWWRRPWVARLVLEDRTTPTLFAQSCFQLCRAMTDSHSAPLCRCHSRVADPNFSTKIQGCRWT